MLLCAICDLQNSTSYSFFVLLKVKKTYLFYLPLSKAWHSLVKILVTVLRVFLVLLHSVFALVTKNGETQHVSKLCMWKVATWCFLLLRFPFLSNNWHHFNGQSQQTDSGVTVKHILAIINLLFYLFNFYIPWDVVRWTTWTIEVILGVFATTLTGISRNVMNCQTGLLLEAETYKSLSRDFFLLLTW